MIVIGALFFSEADAAKLAPFVIVLVLLSALYRALLLVSTRKKYGDFKGLLSQHGRRFLAFTYPDKNYTYQVIVLFGVSLLSLGYYFFYLAAR